MSRKWLLSTITFILTGGLLLLLLRVQARKEAVRARVWPLVLAVGEPLHYQDSTTSATSWYWEFGQGDTDLARQGKFRYRYPGTYRVRLRVDGHYAPLFTVRVRATPARRDSTIRLLGPTAGYLGEELTFQAFGAQANRYVWKFGETGQIDAHEPTVIYKYNKAGLYKVQLITDVSRYPLVQRIRIQPRYSQYVQPFDSTEYDIKRRLQRIANGQQVNQHYTYLLNKYLCDKADAPVVAGSQPPTDFYSYCMNLQFDPNWVIDAVSVVSDSTANCPHKLVITKLVVTQHKGE